MKIVIAGGLGHLGSDLIRELPKSFDKCEFIIIDSLVTQRFSSLFELPMNAKYKFIPNDIRLLTEEEKELCAGSSLFIHLAALTDISDERYSLNDLLENNLESTKSALAICSSNKIPIIFPSSTSVYSQSGTQLLESFPLQDNQNNYAQCKLLEERLVEEFFESGGSGNILRLGTIHGASRGMRFHTAVNRFCFQSAIGKPFSVWESAMDQLRPYLSLKDFREAIIFLLNRENFDNEIYNLATASYTVKEIIDKIEKVSRKKISIQVISHSLMNDLSFTVSTSKIEDIGFKFKGCIDEDIHSTINLLGDFS